MIKLKKFNDKGMEAFRDFIESTRMHEKNTNGIRLPFISFHNDSNLILDIEQNIDLDEKKIFHDRYEMAHYLNKQIGSLYKPNDNYEIWAWITSLYFDQFIRKKPINSMVTNRFEHYIPYAYLEKFFPANANSPISLNYRHCVMTPLFLVQNYEDLWCKYLLKDRMDTMGEVLEHSFSNKANLKSKKLRELILELYQDKKTFTAKSGCFNQPKNSGSSGKGGVRRFNLIRDRTKKSYDIEIMDVKTIISKMGYEINSSRWVK